MGGAGRRAGRVVPRALRYTTGAVLALAGRLGALALGALVAIALARWLGPAARGEFALVTLVPGVLVALAGLGLGTAELHFVSRDVRRFGPAAANLLVFTLGASLVTAALLLLFSPLLARAVPIFRDPLLVVVVLMSVPQLLFYSNVHQLLQAMRSFAWSSALIVIGYVLFLAALVVFIGWLSLGLAGALAAWLVSHFLLALAGLWALLRTGPLARPDLALLRVELAYGVPSWLAGLSLTVATRAPLFVSGIALAPDAVGHLAVAITLAELLWYGAESAAVVLTPLVARASGTGQAVPTPFVTRVVLLATMCGALVVGLLGASLLALLFGPDFAPAETALRALLPGIVALSTTKVLASDLFGRGRPGLALAAYAAGAVVSVVLAVALVPGQGIVGAALASTAAYAVAAVMLVAVYARETGTRVADLLVPTAADVRAAWRLGRAVPGAPTRRDGGVASGR